MYIAGRVFELGPVHCPLSAVEPATKAGDTKGGGPVEEIRNTGGKTLFADTREAESKGPLGQRNAYSRQQEEE
jgi:hypothetical protein